MIWQQNGSVSLFFSLIRFNFWRLSYKYEKVLKSLHLNGKLARPEYSKRSISNVIDFSDSKSRIWKWKIFYIDKWKKLYQSALVVRLIRVSCTYFFFRQNIARFTEMITKSKYYYGTTKINKLTLEHDAACLFLQTILHAMRIILFTDGPFQWNVPFVNLIDAKLTGHCLTLLFLSEYLFFLHCFRAFFNSEAFLMTLQKIWKCQSEWNLESKKKQNTR